MTKTMTGRFLCLTLSLLCALACFTGVSTADSPAAEYVPTCLIRNSASPRAAVIGRMEDGAAVDILDEYGDYYRIDCYDMTGYIAKSQVIPSEDGRYYVNCREDSAETSLLECSSAAEVLQLRASLLGLLKKQLGTPYVYGGSAPGGFDCSGLTSYVYKKNGITLHRRASQQMQDGLIVAKEGLQAGDLVFFRTPGTTTLCSHVGMYVGNNQIIHAGSQGIAYGDLDDPWFADYYLCARRIVNISSRTVDPVAAVTADSAAEYTPAIGIRRVQ